MTDKEWEDIVNFEGNAQGFRLMQQNQGLQLTYATMAAFTKYPRESKISARNKARKSQKKYGFFQSEKQAFEDYKEKGFVGWIYWRNDLLVSSVIQICSG